MRFKHMNKYQTIFIIARLMHCFKTYFNIQNLIVFTEPVFSSLPFFKTSLTGTLSGMVRLRSLATSDGLSIQSCSKTTCIVFMSWGLHN